MKKQKRILNIFSWILFDWASAPFSGIILTFVFSTYYSHEIAIDRIVGTVQWGNAIAVSGIIIALLGPLFAAMADNEGRLKPWVALFSALTAKCESLVVC